MTPELHPFVPDWPKPDPRYLQDETAKPPELPLADVFGPRWAQWITLAAQSKSSPVDYVVAALLAAVGTAIGNTRWASPWQDWAEPPILWTMAIGAPSSNKSPGLDAVLTPQKEVEREMRRDSEVQLAEWREGAEVAKLAESAWKDAVKSALKDGSEPPSRPETANPGPEPFLPRLSVTDGTVERLAVIAAQQPRGTLMARDELAGWLYGMTRYAGGGSDRPFWLEAYGGRGYTVERMGREPIHIDRLSIGVVGGIQPDRLKTLLLKSDDDGLLARFLPIWPNPAPIKRPSHLVDEVFLERALTRLLSLEMQVDEHDRKRPWLVLFTEKARDQLDAFRHEVRELETGSEGLLLSFTGKLPGLSVRLSLVLAMLDWTTGQCDEPHEITAECYGRAVRFVRDYALPMAERSYAGVSLSMPERAARRLVKLIKDQGWQRFTTREVLRLDRSGLATASDLNPALAMLEEGDVIRAIETPPKPGGGRPPRVFAVNPLIEGTMF